MKVAVYHNNNDVRIEEWPKPAITNGEILVKVKGSGICGTDVMEWYRIKKAPKVLGHEIAGEIVESKSGKFKVGQRVFVSHHVPCNSCKYCSDGNHTACETLHKGNYDPGGFSEYVRIPKINVDCGTYELDTLTFEEGTMIEPLACAVRALNLININKGQTVLILGTGISGLLAIQLAKLYGAKVIAADIDEYRLQKAKEFGAFEVLNAKYEINLKADKIIMCTGAMKAVEQTFKSIDKKGTILFFAIPNKNIEIPIVDFWRNEWTITTSYGAAPIDLEESINLIKNRKINVKDMVTHKLPLERIQEAFKIVADAKESLKVVVKF
ncbi:MAG: alcohol dehydrogenase catalytic domain-containing protein [Nanoarchaeota archaeon]